MEILEPMREVSFLCANYQSVLEALKEAEKKALVFVDKIYSNTTKPTIYVSEITPLREKLEQVVAELQRENGIWLKKECSALEALTLKEVANSEELKYLEELHREYTQNEQALEGISARVQEINSTFEEAAKRSKDSTPKPPKNAATLEKEKIELVAQKEQRVGILEKIKTAFLNAKEKVVAFVQRLKERGFLDKALQLRADFAKAWEFAQKLFEGSKALAEEAKELIQEVLKQEGESNDPNNPTIQTDANYKP